MTTIEASQLVAALEQAWTAIQARHEDVPDVVVTLGAGSIGAARGTLKLGHFAVNRWVGASADGTETAGVAELFVGGEGLRHGAANVLGTLLHEAVHGIASVRGIQDTSRQGRYHNAKFRELGAEVGLTITKQDGIGWSGTDVPESTRAAYLDELGQLTAALTAWRYAEGFVPVAGGSDDDEANDGDNEAGDEAEAKKPKNGYALVCGCSTPRRIRVAASTAALGPIVCGVCEKAFTETEQENSK